MRNKYSNVLRKILTTLKSSEGCSLEDLIHTLPREYHSLDIDPHYLVLESISTLVRWGLAEAYTNGKLLSNDKILKFNRWEWPKNLSFYVAKTALEIEDTLDVTLDAIQTTIFGESEKSFIYDWLDIFVLMPFSDEMRPIYEDHIKGITKHLGLHVARSDDFFTNGSIMADIWSAINHTSIVIADCTGRNPNVFYEIGLAHAIGRSTILITQSIEDIPFDLRHLRVIVYDFTPRGMKQFEKTLENSIKILLSKHLVTN